MSKQYASFNIIFNYKTIPWAGDRGALLRQIFCVAHFFSSFLVDRFLRRQNQRHRRSTILTFRYFNRFNSYLWSDNIFLNTRRWNSSSIDETFPAWFQRFFLNDFKKRKLNNNQTLSASSSSLSSLLSVASLSRFFFCFGKSSKSRCSRASRETDEKLSLSPKIGRDHFATSSRHNC